MICISKGSYAVQNLIFHAVYRNGGNHGKETYSINDFRWLWIK